MGLCLPKSKTKSAGLSRALMSRTFLVTAVCRKGRHIKPTKPAHTIANLEQEQWDAIGHAILTPSVAEPSALLKEILWDGPRSECNCRIPGYPDLDAWNADGMDAEY